VAGRAKRLERPGPETLEVALVRWIVMNDRSRDDATFSLAALAQGLGSEHPAADALPPCELIEAAPLGCLGGALTWHGTMSWTRPTPNNRAQGYRVNPLYCML